MEVKNTAKGSIKINKTMLGPGKITVTDDEMIVEFGSTKIILSKDVLILESPQIIFNELKKEI